MAVLLVLAYLAVGVVVACIEAWRKRGDGWGWAILFAVVMVVFWLPIGVGLLQERLLDPPKPNDEGKD